jgi:hypothetical protein
VVPHAHECCRTDPLQSRLRFHDRHHHERHPVELFCSTSQTVSIAGSVGVGQDGVVCACEKAFNRKECKERPRRARREIGVEAVSARSLSEIVSALFSPLSTTPQLHSCMRRAVPSPVLVGSPSQSAELPFRGPAPRSRRPGALALREIRPEVPRIS